MAPKVDLSSLRTRFDQYANKYQTIKMRRQDGILEVQLHTNDGPLQWGRLPHAELEEAFLNISRDRENQVVILTGTGNQFSGPRIADSSANRTYHRHSPEDWAELAWESKGLLNNLLAIEVPMIAAVNGPAVRHPELPAMCDIVLAVPEAEFQDSAHYQGGLVPGDGVHVVFSMIMGLNRARYFLMTGQVLRAEEAKAFGLVNEIVPADKLMDRAWEHARQLLRQPAINRKFARVLVTEQLRRQIQELLPYGLALEALAATG
jgi:enoyl-CoA hydratase/carnithine racemase